MTSSVGFRVPPVTSGGVRPAALLLSLALCALGPPAAVAFDLPLWSTIDAGGGTAAGGLFTLVGSAGQPDAGQMSGGVIALRGGYIGGGVHLSAVGDPDEPLPAVTVFSFHPIAPNPFNPTTTIAFDLPAPSVVSLRIYDSRGALVKVLLEEMQAAGRHEVTWRGDDAAGRGVASGVYLVQFSAGPDLVRRKITLVR